MEIFQHENIFKCYMAPLTYYVERHSFSLKKYGIKYYGNNNSTKNYNIHVIVK